MHHKSSRSLVDLGRRLPPATARLLGEATQQGRPVRALVALLVVMVLGTGGYVAGRAMTGGPEDPQAGPADPTASYDGGRPEATAVAPASDDQTSGARSEKPSGSATGRSEAPSPSSAATSTPTPRPRHSSAAGPPSTAAGTPSTSPSQPGVTESAVPKDVTPPQTVLSQDLPASDAALFTFTANEPATFTCSLDDAAYTPCDSPLRYLDLAAGWHTLSVRATDAAGNTDPTPAESRWHADKGHPAD
jgi:hypothetical protein